MPIPICKNNNVLDENNWLRLKSECDESSGCEMMNPEDGKMGWRTVLDETEASYKELVHENKALSCVGSLDDFFNAFLRDEAEHGFSAFQRNIVGDTELEVTPWRTFSGSGDSSSSNEEDGVSLSCSRSISYVHSVNAGPMAPPSARATKDQHLRWFGTSGICLDTRTTVTGVPVSDCFYVEDRLLIEANESEGKVSISSSFEIRFVKKTMFKKIVRVTTGEEMKTFWEAYVRFCEDAMDGASSATKEVPVPSLLDSVICGWENISCGMEEMTTPLFDAVEEIATHVDAAISAMTIPILDTATSNAKAPMQYGKTLEASRSSYATQLPVKELALHAEEGVELTYIPRIANEVLKVSSEAESWQLIRAALIKECFLGSSDREVLGNAECYCVPEWKLEEATADLLASYKAFDKAIVVSSLLRDNTPNMLLSDRSQQPPSESLQLERSPSFEVALFEIPVH